MKVYKIINGTNAKRNKFNSVSFYTYSRESNNLWCYVKSKQGTEIKLIDKKMGNVAEEIIEQFFISMGKQTIKISECSNFYNQIILLMISFLDINYNGEIFRGGQSFCSHANGFITFSSDPKMAKQRLEQYYLKNKDILINIVNLYCKGKIGKFEKNNMKNIFVSLDEEVKSSIRDNKIYFINYSQNNLLKKK